MHPADIQTWFQNMEQHATEDVNKILIDNKCDWEEKHTVSTERGQALANEFSIPFMEVSAKANINVEEAFLLLARDIKKWIMDSTSNEKSSSRIDVGKDPGSGTNGMKCC